MSVVEGGTNRPSPRAHKSIGIVTAASGAGLSICAGPKTRSCISLFGRPYRIVDYLLLTDLV